MLLYCVSYNKFSRSICSFDDSVIQFTPLYVRAQKLSQNNTLYVSPCYRVQHILPHSIMPNSSLTCTKNTRNAPNNSLYHAQNNAIVVEMIHCKSTDVFSIEKYHIFPNNRYLIQSDILYILYF